MFLIPDERLAVLEAPDAAETSRLWRCESDPARLVFDHPRDGSKEVFVNAGEGVFYAFPADMGDFVTPVAAVLYGVLLDRDGTGLDPDWDRFTARWDLSTRTGNMIPGWDWDLASGLFH